MKKNGKKEPLSREEYEKKLLAMLTPEGEKFSQRLDKALRDECDGMRNNAADAIRSMIEAHHLKSIESIKAMNTLAASYTRPGVTCCYLMMNYANILLTSGDFHRRRGELTVTGQQLLEIWRIYANRLVDKGAESSEQIEQQERVLLHHIGNLGSSGLSVIGAIKSLFAKKSGK